MISHRPTPGAMHIFRRAGSAKWGILPFEHPRVQQERGLSNTILALLGYMPPDIDDLRVLSTVGNVNETALTRMVDVRSQWSRK